MIWRPFYIICDYVSEIQAGYHYGFHCYILDQFLPYLSNMYTIVKEVIMQGYKHTHITFMPYTATPSSILHSTVQGINKETPFPAATFYNKDMLTHRESGSQPIGNSIAGP